MGGKQVVEVEGEVGGTITDDPGPVSRGPNDFLAEPELDSFME